MCLILLEKKGRTSLCCQPCGTAGTWHGHSDWCLCPAGSWYRGRARSSVREQRCFLLHRTQAGGLGGAPGGQPVGLGLCVLRCRVQVAVWGWGDAAGSLAISALLSLSRGAVVAPVWERGTDPLSLVTLGPGAGEGWEGRCSRARRDTYRQGGYPKDTATLDGFFPVIQGHAAILASCVHICPPFPGTTVSPFPR